MGLTIWKNAPKGNIRKTDVVIAKNYLTESEMDGLNRIVTMYLDYAESQALRGVVMYMQDWVQKLDAFLEFNDKLILHHKGNITHEQAIAHAESEFEKFRLLQLKSFESDFDRVLRNKLNQGQNEKTIP